eukprot:CAMPEP_0174264966 /NCGR_PEP_ID=MMETSP0439-20130205/24632_1 /TAXON_ID=0 /ORGANISM="Stereomyxa ramosa, Strain Chinc5" /LENGTH=436 /DNA_ID=CAMNT_0015351147 /DNA_START=103 /DNA_END=1413 /DNA_ORIENTATION=-
MNLYPRSKNKKIKGKTGAFLEVPSAFPSENPSPNGKRKRRAKEKRVALSSLTNQQHLPNNQNTKKKGRKREKKRRSVDNRPHNTLPQTLPDTSFGCNNFSMMEVASPTPTKGAKVNFELSILSPHEQMETSQLEMNISYTPCSQAKENIIEQESVKFLRVSSAKDIDVSDRADPQWVTTYVNDIYKNLLDSEKDRAQKIRDYLAGTERLTSNMRAILVDWLVEVAEEYELSSETLYLSVLYLDCFLSKRTVKRRNFQLLGVTAMLIAAKYEEIFPPQVDDFVNISANTYTRQEILAMEVELLDGLEFDLAAATAKVFLRRYLKAAGADLRLAFLASYLCELTLKEYNMNIRYLPSQIAASSVYLALLTLRRTPWTPTLEYYTNYNEEDRALRSCIIDLHRLQVDAPLSDLQAVFTKYSDERFHGVSRTPPPTGLNV